MPGDSSSADHANAIGTVYLRAGYLADRTHREILGLMRQYAPLAVAGSDFTQVEANSVRGKRARTADVVDHPAMIRDHRRYDVIATYVESLNELINVHDPA